MVRLHFVRLMLVLLFVVGSTSLLSAQAGEVYVFGGGYWHGTSVFDDRNMPGGGTYGVKAGGFLSPNFQLDGNLSWYNHFGVLDEKNAIEVFRPVTDILSPKVRSLLWEASGTWDFSEKKIGANFSPYITLGIGGITARIKDTDQVFVTGGGFIRNPMYITDKSPVPQFIPNPARQIVLDNNDTFLTFSYGGGVKGMRLWGPAGFRFDFRGRTIPNFFGSSTTRPELTGGLVFNWGER